MFLLQFLILHAICTMQWRSQEGLGPLQKNLNRSESTAQNFLEGPRPSWLLPCVARERGDCVEIHPILEQKWLKRRNLFKNTKKFTPPPLKNSGQATGTKTYYFLQKIAILLFEIGFFMGCGDYMTDWKLFFDNMIN